MQYSPKLKKAMEEIKQITKKYDIAAFVILHDETKHSEFLNEVRPSYSIATVMEGEGIRFKVKASEVGIEEANRRADLTYNMITHFKDLLSFHAGFYVKTWNQLKILLGGEEGSGNYTGHTTQNN